MAKKAKAKVDTLEDFDPITTALQLGLHEKPVAAITSIDDLLSHEESLIEVAQLVASGASTSTVDLHLGLQPGMVDRWLRLGVKDREGAFRVFYLFYSKAASVARSGAESSLLAKNPDKWLEKIDVLSQLHREADTLGTLPPPGTMEGGTRSSTSTPNASNNSPHETGLTFINVPTDPKET